MPQHTEAEMEQMSFEDLKKAAAEPVEVKEDKPESVAVAAESTDEPETFIARREVDSGDGAGVEIFEAEGATEKEALDALADKIAEGKRNASKKIREQEAELRTLRARAAEPPKPKEINPDDEYIIAQEMAKMPIATFRKMFKQQVGFEIEEVAEMKKTADAVKANQQANAAINTFCATHPDYENDDKAGERNGELMRMKLTELRLPVTSENLSKAYLHLKQSGLLTLKGEEANSEANGKTEETERIASAKVEPAPQRTKKVSSISTHSRTTAVPVSTDPSEAELYTMPLEELRARANKQMSSR